MEDGTIGEVKENINFNEKLLKLISMQQEANKHNLTLQIANIIMSILLFILLLIGVVLK